MSGGSGSPWKRHLVWSLAMAIAAADQAVKWWMGASLSDGRVVRILPTVELDLTHNEGFAFGTTAVAGHWLGLLVVLLVAALAVAIVRAPTGLPRLGLGLALGGAVGNLTDRVVHARNGWLSGTVVDFVDVSWFAVFNLADAAIVLGVAGFALAETRAAHSDSDPTLLTA